MKTAVALGTFDGLHLAHRSVCDLPSGFKKVALTFEKPPKMLISGNTELIYTFEDKCKYLKELGFDEIVTLDFQQVKNTDPLDFLNFLKDEIRASYISCGFNYHFGKNGGGDTDTLIDFCNKNSIQLKIMPSYLLENGETLSSSYIRGLLKNGDVEKANNLLFKPFGFTAMVQKGDRRGRTIGFPTINQKYPKDLVKLRFGVYKTKAIIDCVEYDAITNIGIRPTYETDYVISETFIKNFSGDLYGREVKIIPVKFLRDEKKFNSLEELKKQIAKDLEN